MPNRKGEVETYLRMPIQDRQHAGRERYGWFTNRLCNYSGGQSQQNGEWSCKWYIRSRESRGKKRELWTATLDGVIRRKQTNGNRWAQVLTGGRLKHKIDEGKTADADTHRTPGPFWLTVPGFGGRSHLRSTSSCVLLEYLCVGGGREENERFIMGLLSSFFFSLPSFTEKKCYNTFCEKCSCFSLTLSNNMEGGTSAA